MTLNLQNNPRDDHGWSISLTSIVKCFKYSKCCSGMMPVSASRWKEQISLWEPQHSGGNKGGHCCLGPPAPRQCLSLSWLSPSIRGPNGWIFLCTASWTDQVNGRMSVPIKETLMSQCHEETGGTWARALSPQETLRIRSAKLICRAEVVLDKGFCKDTHEHSLLCS